MFSKKAKPSVLKLHLLGPFCISVDGVEVEERGWSRRKPKLLVKLLALQPHHRLHREQIMELLWPELSPESAANSLHKTIHLARHALEPDLKAGADSSFLLTQGQQLILSAPIQLWLDVEEFERQASKALRSADPAFYETALELYQGELLAEDLYEDWVAPKREQLRTLYQDLLLQLGRLYQGQGQYNKSIECLSRVIAGEPSNEEAHRELMRLYALTGNRYQSQRQYHLCVNALRNQLDAEPESLTTSLYKEIISGEIQPVHSTHIAANGVNSPSFSFEAPAAPMINRVQELEKIKTLLKQTQEGKGAVLLLGGEAGIGKTRLAREALERGQRKGALLLMGGCYEQEGQLPYGPFVEAFDRYARSQSREMLEKLLGDWVEPFSRFVPAIGQRLGRAEVHPPEPHDKQRLFAAVLGVLKQLTQNAPVVMLLDDLHAADGDSLTLLHHLARTAGSFPLLIIGTYREEDTIAPNDAARLIASLYRQRLAINLSLQPLSRNDSESLICELLNRKVNSELVDYIYDVGTGNPFFTEEIVRTMLEQGQVEKESICWLAPTPGIAVVPSGLRDWVKVRLERAGEQGQKVIACAAVIGREMTFELLMEVTAFAEPALLDLADRLLNAKIFAPTSSGLKFHHPLVREIVYESLSPMRRQQLHGKVAETLEKLYADCLDQHVEVLAHHFSLSQQTEKAIRYLTLAGDRAVSVYANELALRQYEAAVALLSKVESVSRQSDLSALHEKIGDLYSRTGSALAATESYFAAIGAFEENALPDREVVETVARLQRKTAYQLILQSRLEEAEQLLQSARQNLEEAGLGEHLEMARLHYTIANLHWHREQFSDALAAAQSSLNIAEKTGSPADTMLAYEALALTSLPLGDWKSGLEYEGLRQSLCDLNRDIAAISDVHL